MLFLYKILIVASIISPILAVNPIPITLAVSPRPTSGGKFLIIDLPGPWDLKPMPHCHPHPYINRCARKRIHRILEVLDSMVPDPIPPARHVPIAGTVDRILWVHKHLMALVAVWDWEQAGPRRKRGEADMGFNDEEGEEEEEKQGERCEEPTRTVGATNTT